MRSMPCDYPCTECTRPYKPWSLHPCLRTLDIRHRYCYQMYLLWRHRDAQCSGHTSSYFRSRRRKHGRRKRGDGGDASPAVKNQRGTSPQKWWYFSIFFLDTYENFAFFTIFKIKWPKFEEKQNFGGRWVSVPMNPSPPNKTSCRRPWTKKYHYTRFYCDMHYVYMLINSLKRHNKCRISYKADHNNANDFCSLQWCRGHCKVTLPLTSYLENEEQ